MRYEVRWTAAAAADLDEIIDWIDQHDSPLRAAHVEQRIEETVATLETSPERGAHPKELIELGIREFRQVFFKPYRVIYRVADRTVYIALIADGRRDMQTLLARRLLGG